jgi:hypothetical protein
VVFQLKSKSYQQKKIICVDIVIAQSFMNDKKLLLNDYQLKSIQKLWKNIYEFEIKQKVSLLSDENNENKYFFFLKIFLQIKNLFATKPNNNKI